jgi:hypothetical protein
LVHGIVSIIIQQPGGNCMKVVHFDCGNCGQRIVMGRRFWGRQVRCNACGTVLLVPQPDAEQRPTQERTLFLGLGWIGVSVILGVLVAIGAALSWAIAVSNTWEMHHKGEVLELISGADAQFDDGQVSQAVEVYRHVITQVGDHEICDTQFAQALARSRQRVLDYQAKEEEAKRLAAEAHERELAKQQEAVAASSRERQTAAAVRRPKERYYRDSHGAIIAESETDSRIAALRVQIAAMSDSAAKSYQEGVLQALETEWARIKSQGPVSQDEPALAVGHVNYSLVDRHKLAWQSGGWKNKTNAEKIGAMNAIIQSVEDACPDPADRNATLDYIQSHIDGW